MPISTIDQSGLTSPLTLASPTLTSPALAGTPTGVGVLTSGAVITPTTQTTIDFTNIPSWAKRVTINYSAVSLSSTTPDYWVQLGYGTTPTFENTNYANGAVFINSANIVTYITNITTAFTVARALAAVTDVISGAIVLTNLSGNTWSMMGVLGRSGNNGVTYTSGAKTISGGALSAIRLTTSTGTDQYDAGSVNILYE